VEPNKNKGRWKLLAVILVCAAPIILSYFTYYVIKPQSRTNYGTILDPRNYPTPKLDALTLDKKPASLDDYQGKWVMLLVSSAECSASCEKKLHDIRQLRLAQGKEMERIERVWLITDDKPIDTILIREFDGTDMLRIKADAVRAWLPVDEGTDVTDHIYMIDPLGHLMMRFPKDADPNKIKKDLYKLLKASAIG
jgi:cytochrome oxidase Cu insertion factor (SCO1/SenC/PrrC family)